MNRRGGERKEGISGNKKDPVKGLSSVYFDSTTVIAVVLFRFVVVKVQVSTRSTRV